MNTNWYHSDGQQTFGPLPEEQIIALIQSDQLTGDHFVVQEGSEDWRPLSASPFANHLTQPSPAEPQVQQPRGVAPARRTGATPVPARTPAARSATQAAVQAHRGLNRNMVILGTLALLTLGGLGFFLASRKAGNIANTKQNTTNQITNNSYFTQLIASGATTEKDLEAVTDIRPYGDDFIGISKEPLAWTQAQDLAKRTGSETLSVPEGSSGSQQELLKWLSENYGAHLSSTVWVMQRREVRVLDGPDVLPATAKDRPRKAFLRWVPGGRSGVPVDQSGDTPMTKLSPLSGQVPSFWMQDGAVARIKGEGAIAFPAVSISSYVLEVDLVMHSPKGKVSLICGGRPGIDVALGDMWPQDRNQTKIPCRLFRVHPNGGVSWSGERHFEPDQRMTLTLFVADDFWVLKRNGARILTARGDPVDLTLKIKSKEEADATIYNIAWRRLVDADIADMGPR